MAKQKFNDYLATVDSETLAIGSDSCILSIGVTVSKYEDKDITFEQLVSAGFSMKFDLAEQRANGRTVSDKVVRWWMDQSPEARKVVMKSSNDVSLYTLHDELVKFFVEKDIDIMKVDMFDRRNFDLSKMEYLFVEEQKLDRVPWDHLNEYEVSSALRFMGYDRYGGIHVKDIPGAVYHNAIHDAAVDHLRILKCLHSTLEEE